MASFLFGEFLVDFPAVFGDGPLARFSKYSAECISVSRAMRSAFFGSVTRAKSFSMFMRLVKRSGVFS